MAEATGKKPEEIIQQESGRWRDAMGLEEETMIRLAILRDIFHALHAEKSQYLSKKLKDDAQQFKPWELRLEELRTAAELKGELMDVFQIDYPIKKKSRFLPEALFSVIAKEKFDRYDRTWEASLAGEAASLGWCFWNLLAWVGVEQASEAHKTLCERLMPHGVVLWAETIEPHKDEPAPSPDSPLWHARWIVTLKPQYRTPDFRVSQINGIWRDPEPPVWKILFSAHKR